MEIIIKRDIVDPYGTSKRSTEGRRVDSKKDWVVGWWENISPTPVYIRDKQHLKQVCQAESRRTGRTIIPKAFAKRSSQGNTLEWNF